MRLVHQQAGIADLLKIPRLDFVDGLDDRFVSPVELVPPAPLVDRRVRPVVARDQHVPVPAAQAARDLGQRHEREVVRREIPDGGDGVEAALKLGGPAVAVP